VEQSLRAVQLPRIWPGWGSASPLPQRSPGGPMMPFLTGARHILLLNVVDPAFAVIQSWLLVSPTSSWSASCSARRRFGKVVSLDARLSNSLERTAANVPTSESTILRNLPSRGYPPYVVELICTDLARFFGVPLFRDGDWSLCAVLGLP